MSAPLQLAIPCGNGYSLNVAFQFVEGRFRQSISLTDTNGVTHDHWEDAFDSADADWPLSPPIQQLSLESIQDRPTLLGVGQAGKSHWSISVEHIDAPEQGRLRFDLACRTRSVPSWLGSTYKRVMPSPTEGHFLALQSEQGTQTESCSLTIACDSSGAAAARYPATFRWSYWITANIPLTRPSRLP